MDNLIQNGVVMNRLQNLLNSGDLSFEERMEIEDAINELRETDLHIIHTRH